MPFLAEILSADPAIPQAADPVVFAELLAALHARRYTGAVTLHFFSGVPNSAELPQEPIRFRLIHAAPLDTVK